jgi:hypothetical protein
LPELDIAQAHGGRRGTRPAKHFLGQGARWLYRSVRSPTTQMRLPDRKERTGVPSCKREPAQTLIITLTPPGHKTLAQHLDAIIAGVRDNPVNPKLST